MKKISIVTISFNQKEFISECINSVISQNYLNVEHIVVDAGSTDGSREIISSFGDKVIKIFEADKGPADGLNKGFSKASGDIYYFLNSDDFLLEGALERINKEFTENPDIDIVSGSGFIVNEKGKRLKKVWNSKYTPWLYLNGGVSFFQQGNFFTKSIFKKTNGFNPFTKVSWDAELFLNMAIKGAKFKRINHNLAAFRIHKESIRGSQKLAAEFKKQVQKLYLEKTGKKTPSLINMFLAKLFYIFHKVTCQIFGKLML